MAKILVIISGGMDSTVVAAHLKASGYDVEALSFDYGQQHVRELAAACQSCADMDIPHLVVPFADNMKKLLAGSALTSEDVPIPEGHYADENMKATVVPNRNMVMLALATAYAISIGAEGVAYGAHSGDHAIYPDCRPEFYRAMANVMGLCHYTPVQLVAPFMSMHKGEIVQRGVELGVNFAHTWTCYNGGEEPCGVCGSCVERAEAFHFAGVADPLVSVEETGGEA